MDNWQDLQGNDFQTFLKNYRDSLTAQRDAQLKAVEQARKNFGASAMSTANTSGMLYSNFPARTKIKYDTETYYPAVTSVNTAYQTGLDKIRQNAIDVWNSTKSYQEAISDLNNQINSVNTANTTTTDDQGNTTQSLIDLLNAMTEKINGNSSSSEESK